jgi:hypothetical protein
MTSRTHTPEDVQKIMESWRDSASDYERGFIDGMQKQMQSSVDKAVNAMTQPTYYIPNKDERTWVGLTDEEKDGKRVLENGLLFNTAEVQVWELAVQWAEEKLKERNA